MAVRILHCADIHLGARCAFLGNESRIRQRTEDFQETFARIVSFAADPDNRIDIVLIAGDLFDSANPEPDLVEFVVQQFRKLDHVRVHVYVVPGTHDTYGDPRSVYRRTDETLGATVFRDAAMDRPVTVKCRDEQVFIYGMAEQRHASMRPLAEFKKVPEQGYHIGLLHASIVDINPNRAKTPSEPVVGRDEIAASGLDYLALGHFHNFQQITCGSTVACYTGTPEGRKFGENGERFVAVVEMSAAGVRIEKTAVNRRTLATRSIEFAQEQIESQQEFIDWLGRIGSQDNLLHLKVTGISDFPIDSATVNAAVSDRFFYFELIDETSVVGSAEIERIADEPTVRGLFVKSMLAEIETARTDRDRAVAERALRIGIAEMGFGSNNHVD